MKPCSATPLAGPRRRCTHPTPLRVPGARTAHIAQPGKPNRIGLHPLYLAPPARMGPLHKVMGPLGGTVQWHRSQINQTFHANHSRTYNLQAGCAMPTSGPQAACAQTPAGTGACLYNPPMLDRDPSTFQTTSFGGIALVAGDGMLCLAPHPDDEVLGCAGLLMLAQAQGTCAYIPSLSLLARRGLSLPRRDIRLHPATCA